MTIERNRLASGANRQYVKGRDAGFIVGVASGVGLELGVQLGWACGAVLSVGQSVRE